MTIPYDARDDTANVPTMLEEHTVLCHIAGNKVGGRSGILPEMVKVCSGNLLECFVKLFTHVWDMYSRGIPQDWKDVLLNLVSKKRNLSLCDNWCGISLLEVIGRVIPKIIQRRMHIVVKDLVLDFHCEFRSVSDCNDMIFCAHQLMEKVIEHNTHTYTHTHTHTRTHTHTHAYTHTHTHTHTHTYTTHTHTHIHTHTYTTQTHIHNIHTRDAPILPE